MMKYREAISQSIVQAMETDPKVLLLGEMVTDSKGVFGTCLEAARRFPERVIETPVSETMITGACVGLAMEGWKPIYVHARADFSLLSFEHLINTAAKMQFLHGKPLPFAMRVIIGRGWGQGPVHSQSFHHLLAEIPGLHVVMPATKEYYQYILEMVFPSGKPTVIFEPRRLYECDVADLHHVIFDKPDIQIWCVGDALIDGIEASAILGDLGVRANVHAKERLYSPLTTEDSLVPNLFVDIAPRMSRRNVISPPFWPQGASQVFEQVWYPTAQDIVAESCRLLNVRYHPPSKEKPEVSMPVGGPF